MSKFNSCLVSLNLRDSLPVDALRATAAEYQEQDGLEPAAALLRAAEEHLDMALMEEQDIIRIVREKYEARGGKKKNVPAVAPAAAEVKAAEPKPASVEEPPAPILLDITRSQIETEAFKKWFGDSKVVDENGEPLVLYHGTRARDGFTEFKTGDESYFGPGGIFFTDSTSAASKFANSASGAGTVLPVYLSMKNPYVVDFDERSDDVQIEELKAAGYDGIVMETETVEGESDTMYVVFDPKQIKSATGNSGAFDPADPSILNDLTDQRTIEVDGERRPIKNSRGQLVAPDFEGQVAFWKWFGNSKAVDPMEHPKVMYHGTSRLTLNGYKKDGTKEQIDAFRSDTSEGSGAIYVTDSPDYANQYTNSQNPQNGGQVYPVYVKAERPFEFYNEVHMAKLRGVLTERHQFGAEGFRDGRANDYVSESEWRHLENGSFGVLERPLVRDAMQAAGFDSYYVREQDGGWDNEADAPRDVMSLAVFAPEQIKSATGNAGTFDPADPVITRDLMELMRGHMAESEAPKRVAVTAKLKAARRRLDAGEISEGDYRLRIDAIISALDERNAAKAAPKERERGPDWVIERLMRARRTGELDPAAVNLALWALNKNPALADDLGISLRAPNQSGTAGMYNPVSRVMTLFKGAENTGTAVHEILHHSERMMPPEVQAQIVKAWKKAFSRAYAKADEKTRAALMDMLIMAADRRAAERVMQAMKDGVLDYDQHYQLSNASEFWAVNATRIMGERHAADSWVAKARQWFKELMLKVRGWLGLRSDAAVLKGLQAVLNGTGEKLSPRMLVEQAYTLRDITRPLPAAVWAPPAMTKLDDIVHVLQDKFIDMKKVVKAIREQTGALEDKWNPYLQEELFHGRSATGFKSFLNDELRPLLDDMKMRGVEMAEFEEYLHNRHAKEANEQIARVNPDMPDGGSRIDTADAQNYLAGLAPAKERAYAALAARVDAITKATQEMLVEYGLEKQETIDAWNATYQHYVPLMREDMDAVQMGNGTGAGFSTRGSASQRRMGSSRAVVDILANVAMARERTVVRGEKNRLDLALYGLALKAPNPDFWKPVNPQKNPAALQAELVNMGLSPAMAAAIVDEPKQRVIDPRTGLVVKRVNTMLRSSPNVIAVRVGGEDRFIFFNERSERALRMAQSLKNIGIDQLGKFTSTIAVMTRYFAAINTQYNPIFGAVNLVRDIGESTINLSSTPIAGKQADVLREVASLFGKVVKGRGRLSNLSGADAALWDEFQTEGGITGFRAMFNTSEDRAREIASELNPDQWMESKWGKVFTAGGKLKVPYSVARKVSTPLFDWLSDYNEALENITRMATYKVGKANGMTNQQAASIAKSISVNFNRTGAVTRQVGAWYAFFNAAAQGTARMLETLTGPAGKRIIAGGLMLGAVQAVLLAAAGFDDLDPPEFVKSRNFIVPLGTITGERDYITVPLPLGFNFLPNTGRLFTEYALGGAKHTGRYMTHMMDVLMDTFNPIGNSGFSLQTIMPTPVDPLAALAENRDFTGKPIYREDMSKMDPSPGYTRAKDTASAIGKGVAYYTNLWSGGTEYSPGQWSPTPDQIDYLLGQFTGGVGRELMKTQQSITATVTGEELPAYKVPLVGRFYGESDDKSGVGTKFYDYLQQSNLHAAEVEGRQKDKKEFRSYLQEHPEARLADMGQAVQRDLAKLRKQKRELVGKGGERDKVKLIEERMRTRMSKFNERYEQAVKRAEAVE